MNFKSLIAATAMIAAASASFATSATPIVLTATTTTTSTDYSGSFGGNAATNVFSFDLTGLSGGNDLYAQVSANYTLTGGYNITNVTFDGQQIDAIININGSKNGADLWEYNFGGLTAAPHELIVTGFAKGTSIVGFTGSVGISNTPFVSVSAVPEPESYALMLAGLGVMGAIARRRNKSKSV